MVGARRWTALMLTAAVLVALCPVAPPRAAAEPTVSVSLDRGEGATYRVGDTVTITYTLSEPAWIRFTSQTAEGEHTVAEGFARNAGGTLQAQVGPPAGRHRLLADVYTGPDGQTIVATAETWFMAEAAGAAPPAAVPTPAAPPQRVTLSAADVGRTVTVPVGSTIDVAFLEADYTWTPFQFDSYVLQMDTPNGIFPATFRARNAGTTNVSANGTPNCRTAQPACFQPDRAFQFTVIVQ